MSNHQDPPTQQPPNDNDIRELASAQQNAINRLEDILQNQRALHRALSDRRAVEETRLPRDHDGDGWNGRGRENNNIRGRSRLFWAAAVLVVCFIAVYSRSGSVTSVDIDRSNSAKSAIDSTAISGQAAIDSSGNPLLQAADGWDAVVKLHHKKREGIPIIREAATSHEAAPVTPPKSRPSTQLSTWDNLINYFRHRYLINFDRLEQHPYSLGLTPHHRKNITGHIKVIQKRSMRTIDL
jgi:hypothetical protein